MSAHDPGAELVDVLDDAGRVIAQTPRRDMRARRLPHRCVYILVLLAVLYVVYQSFAWAIMTLGSRMSAAELARFGETFFGYYLMTQYVVILLITPAYVAGAIAEEKQRKTLEYMLATDLRNREIVFGKLVARLANLLLFLLAGLPVISFAQLFGGIAPELLTKIFQHGDAGDKLYLILEGKVRISREVPGMGEEALAVLGPGQIFGELALLVEDGTRVARVRATSAVRCISIPRDDFLCLVETEPAFALHLLRELARRLVEARATT